MVARLPTAKARVTGAAVKNPQRYRDHADPKVAPLGDPPDWLDEIEQRCWYEFRDELPWLCKSDTVTVAQACRLRRKLMTDPDMGVNAHAQLRMCLAAMGGSPVTRSKIDDPNGDDDSEADEFNLN